MITRKTIATSLLLLWMLAVQDIFAQEHAKEVKP